MKGFNILIISLLLVYPTIQESDQSFEELCLAKNGDYKPQSGQSYLPNQCIVTIQFDAQTLEDANYHCTRWGLWALDKAEVTAEHYAKCTYSEIYTCRPEFKQIRGRCYRWHNTLMSYGEAVRKCGEDKSVVLRMYDELGELFDDNIDDLSIYHVQPDESLDSSPRFFGGSGPNYVVLFSHAIHYRAGYNTIHRFANDQKAYTICQYQPAETFFSFSLAIKKLGSLYHASMVSGETLIWRTSGLYTRKYYSYFNADSKEKERICEDSMSAILGTKEGTFANPNNHLTSLLTPEVKQSFVVAYAPIEFCPHVNTFFHYFRPNQRKLRSRYRLAIISDGVSSSEVSVPWLWTISLSSM